MAAGAVYAADVTLYGVVDLGLKYSHVDADQSGVDAVDKLEMKSGSQSGSRFGIKGLKTSATVSRLASSSKTALMRIPAASATTAACSAVKRAFISPATSVKWLSAAWGTLGSGNGTYGLLGGMTPFGTSWAVRWKTAPISSATLVPTIR